MKVPDTEFTTRPWRIHAVTRDFDVEDVWQFGPPVPADEFPRVVHRLVQLDPADSSPVVGFLFALRWKIGELLGWDDDHDGLGSRVSSLRERLPDDLRHAATGPDFGDLPFQPLFLVDGEFAAEIANTTMHGVMHIGRTEDGHLQMAVLVKRNGLLGQLYMAAIRPFRHLIVYPQLTRTFERELADSGSRVTA